jgi:integrase
MPKIKGSVVRKAWQSVSIVQKHGKPTYQVDGRPAAGRKFYADKANALAFAEELAKLKGDGGVLALAMPAALRQDALEAAEILMPWGQTLAKAARHYVAFLKSEQARTEAITVKAAIEDYLAGKRQERERGEISPLTVVELENKMRIIETAFADRRIIDIDRSAVQSFLDNLHHRPRGRANLRTKLSQLLNHSRRRGWVAANAAELTSVRVPPRDVVILNVPEVAKLLRAAETDTALLPYVCLGLFAGLRPGEAQQLQWEDVHFDVSQIEVRPEITKTRQRRFVPLDPLLAEWLLPHRRPTGRITGPNFTKNWRELRKAAGLATLSDERSWQDILRHTHATYWLAVHSDRPRLAENLGNSTEVVRNFYRRAVPRASADKFWQLRPKLVGQSNILAFAESF